MKVLTSDKEEDVSQEGEPAREEGDHPRVSKSTCHLCYHADCTQFSVLIQVSNNCNGRLINQALFLEDNRTVYKLSVANSFGSRKEVEKLHKSWETWNTRELANEIAFLKYVRGSEKGRRITKKKRN